MGYRRLDHLCLIDARRNGMNFSNKEKGMSGNRLRLGYDLPPQDLGSTKAKQKDGQAHKYPLSTSTTSSIRVLEYPQSC